jgi:APA family basic amino acid/polyamine antiporter
MKDSHSPQGKEGHLVQYFGLWTGIILVISSIIGSGIYKKVAPMSLDLQSPGLVLLAWALAGLVTMFGVLSIAEIATLMPVSGGPYAYLKKIFSNTLGYYYGWSSFAVIQSASIASISYVFAQSFNAVIPLPRLSEQWESWTLLGIFTPFDNFGVKLMAVLLIGTLAFVNSRGVHQGGRVSNVVTILVLVSIVIIVLLGLTIGGGSFGNVTQVASTYPPEKFGESFGLGKAMFLAMLSAFWAYEGWINIGFVGEEIKHPQRNIPRILIFGILTIIAIYVLTNFTYLYVMPMDDMVRIAQDENSVAAVEVIRRFLGDLGALLISVLVVVTTLGCTNATILTAARIYYAMARHGLFFRKAGFVHPKYNTPYNALAMQAVWSSVLVFSGSFDQLTDMLVFAQFIFYGLVVAGVFVLRRKLADVPRAYKVVGYPVVPALYILFCGFLVINTLIERPREAGIGLALILLGTPFYFLFRRNRKE